MAITLELARGHPDDAEVLAVPVMSDQMAGHGLLDWAYLEQRGFAAKTGRVLSLNGADGPILAVGMGPSADVDTETFRAAGAAVARSSRRQEVVATTILEACADHTPTERAGFAQAFAEGVVLGSYRFTAHKSESSPARTSRLVLIGTGGKRVQAGLDLGARLGDAVSFARDLVNEPGGSLTPRRLAQAAVEMAEREDLTISVLETEDIVEAGLGGILGVNRGSDEPPRLIQVTYEPEGRSRGTVALVGKGITFDSGGLSIKTAEGMKTMKDDMGGGAAVLGAMSAMQAVRPPVRVIAWVPATDNMTGGDATRPGDVLRIRNGMTVEVLNTDAEGRLVLADALSLASEELPDAIVDVATLTGACHVALGNRVAGLMGSDAGWIGQVTDSAERTGEQVWQLPLPEEYRSQLDSEVADLKNIGTGRFGGALVAGLFLREFVDDVIPWAHIDIAGTAWSDTSRGATTKGATGFGVRLLLDLVKNFRRPAR